MLSLLLFLSLSKGKFPLHSLFPHFKITFTFLSRTLSFPTSCSRRKFYSQEHSYTLVEVTLLLSMYLERNFHLEFLSSPFPLSLNFSNFSTPTFFLHHPHLFGFLCSISSWVWCRESRSRKRKSQFSPFSHHSQLITYLKECSTSFFLPFPLSLTSSPSLSLSTSPLSAKDTKRKEGEKIIPLMNSASFSSHY